MLQILRIFKYVRKRLIKLAIENKRLKRQLEYYKAILESMDNRKH
mgnify:FL=1|jgi:hypothetical protein